MLLGAGDASLWINKTKLRAQHRRICLIILFDSIVSPCMSRAGTRLTWKLGFETGSGKKLLKMVEMARKGENRREPHQPRVVFEFSHPELGTSPISRMGDTSWYKGWNLSKKLVTAWSSLSSVRVSTIPCLTSRNRVMCMCKFQAQNQSRARLGTNAVNRRQGSQQGPWSQMKDPNHRPNPHNPRIIHGFVYTITARIV